ncbi:helicase and polymerase-containing protein TEBICHI-like isoform X1 [Nicotiana tabacum]|uniref:Helicase and polymerase-containing protein TEBICHI-like isoform X1 n=2 Tax=Nicotiana tabacum TaxID=4097 RepID=A0AC58UEF0_TOBAC
MDSDTPRARIDQFFASKKKRKSLSPSLKPARAKKDVKISLEGSPSTKGSLDGYLVTSQDDDSKPLRTARGTPVKRNLTLEIGPYLKDENKGSTSLVKARSTISETKTSKEKPVISPDSHVVATRGHGEDVSVTTQGAGNSELKQFATNFLSLYCSELPSSLSLPSAQNEGASKRSGSPSILDVGNKTTKRIRCISSENESNINGKTNFSIEVTEGNTLVGAHISLRKCNNVHVIGSTESETPGSTFTKLHVDDTPKSSRGSSIFSPGETFWNEAIQVADGLFAGNDKFSFQAAQESEALKTHNEIINSNSLGDGECGNKSNKLFNECIETVSDACVVSAVGSLRKLGKDLDGEKSPMPVKHFDFASDEKNFDVVQSLGNNTDIQIISGKKTGSQENVSLSSSPVLSPHKAAQAIGNILEIQDMTPACPVSKGNKDVLIQDTDIMASTTPSEKLNNCAANSLSSNDNTPSSIAPRKNHLDLNHWLPSEICSIYRKKGISKLYSWQVDCLQVDGVLQNRNLVYCASTSAGKSFVAEILMLRRILSSGKMGLLVLPYVSICAEKAEHLEVLLEPVGKHVRSYYGNQGGGSLPKDTAIAVCTIEKANSLINRLLEEGRLSELGIIVIDELHMVGDQNRGYLLELMLTKLRYASGEGNTESSSGESSGSSSGKADPAGRLQIVGMSATLPNVTAVADWLQAALYQTEFRPVPLEEYIKVGSTIYNRKMDIVRTVSKAAELSGKDPDHIVELCNEVVQEGHSVLIFCSSRKGCESTAKHVAKYLKRFSLNHLSDQNESIDITSAIDALRRSPAGLDPVLEETLPAGVAYHHAGLTVEERETVETCYRRGLVHVLAATSTLAAGVNLPARRVIFRQPRIGRDFIDGTRYQQMAGRAGRTGIDTKGESVLICKPEEVKRIMALLNESSPPLHSCLSEDKNGMIHAILEVVAGGIVQTASDINRYVRCTLLNSTKPFDDVVKSAQDSLRWLCHKKFLEWSEDTKLYTVTPLGRASFGSSLSPEESLVVLDDLIRAREGFVLASDLHVVYLVTPINVDVEPDWELYYQRFMELSALDQSVGNRVGVQEPFLMRMAHGAPVRTSYRSKAGTKGLQGKFDNRSLNDHMLSDEHMLRICRRFFVALILSRLVQEVPVVEVCDAFKVARGMVQALQENAGRFASMVSVFCERLGWHDLEGLVSKFQNRVSFGVRAEIVELTTIPYVKGSRARALYKAGFRTPEAIAEASIPEIVKVLFESSSWADQGSAQRRIQLGVAKKIKNGARKIVLDKAEEARLAAFSAFRSLGLDVPTLAQPVISTAAGHNARKEASTSSAEGSTSSFVSLENANQVLCTLSLERSKEVNATNSDSGGDNSKRKTVADKEAFHIEGSNGLSGELNETTHHIDNAKTSPTTLKIKGIEGGGTYGDHNHVRKLQCEGGEICNGRVKEASEKGPMNATAVAGGFESFLGLWEAAGEFYFDVHFSKKSALNSIAPFEIYGIAICWEDSPVYYVNLPRDLFWSNSRRKSQSSPITCGDTGSALPPKLQWEIAIERWNRISTIMRKKDIKKFTWNLKVQIQVLKHPTVSIQRFGGLSHLVKTVGVDLIENNCFLLSPVPVQDAIDLCIVAWILWPDEEKGSSPSIEKEVKKRLSIEAAAAANRNGRWKNQMRQVAHNGCCRRVAQIRALCSVLWKLVISEGLAEALGATEMPLVNILADMELCGIGVDMEGCLHARQILGRKLKILEKEAYKLAGMTFSLYTVADIANVLYGHLQLPIPEGHKKGKQHPSTDKHCLDLLRNEHPIIPVIKEHRTLAKLLNCTLGSICSLARLSMRTQRYTLHGHWLQTSTATGRLSMEEPNLQCVEHMVDFRMNNEDKAVGQLDVNNYKINARDFFVSTQENWLLLTADYSQIELRLMAHFSKDSSLIELLSEPHGDVFTMIAAKWTGKAESVVSQEERDQTKRLVYGILYGMGAKSLAEQIDCSTDEAAERIKSFKRSFPCVASWLQEAVTSCREKGYIETLKGRKRFLAKIKFGNSKEKSKAQRQAVNSICQGSAADIIKIAMINIHSVLDNFEKSPSNSMIDEKFHVLKGRCRIILQVHDELVLEADPSVAKEAGLLLQMSMENAVSLLVPLHVKLKIGRTWGSLEPFQVIE